MIKKKKRWGKKKLNALNENKVQKFVKNKKRRKTDKELKHFKQLQISDYDEDKKSIFSVAESGVSGERWENFTSCYE